MDPLHDAVMKSMDELRRNLKRDIAGMPVLRLAIVADSATQLLVQALRGVAIDRGLALEVYEAPFNQVHAQILDQGSELYAFKPNIVLIWQASERMLDEYRATPGAERTEFADRRIDDTAALASALSSTLSTQIIYLNAIETDDSVFGSFATKVASSWPHQVRRFNFRLMELAASRKDLFLVDLAMLAADRGRDLIQDRRLALSSEVLLSMEFLPEVANRVVDVVDALRGRLHKCLILDLDNTLWGGVIGDDGIDRIELGSLGAGHAYDEIQAWAKALKDRGIVLAVCSKNDERIAMEPFERHPDMTLRPADIAVFVANWENKADNIRHIQAILEVGFDSMVFLDDNPAERAIVRANLPEVCVPELPDDPVDWLPFLQRMNLFETTSVSAEDGERTRQYQQETKRRSLRAVFADEGAFLQSLEMRGRAEGFTPFNIPRVAQLTQRSNQFNLRTVRYGEADLQRLVSSDRHMAFAFSLEDTFGAHGLISVVILEERPEADEIFIDSWLMSCRVLKRGVERFALNTIAAAARYRGATRLVGEYIRTQKNALVQDHYRSLGFSESKGRWILELDTFVDQPHFIATESSE